MFRRLLPMQRRARPALHAALAIPSVAALCVVAIERALR
jgi:hypothetical protein